MESHAFMIKAFLVHIYQLIGSANEREAVMFGPRPGPLRGFGTNQPYASHH